MSVIQGILLGILQGVAEFLPISSSGHLQIAQKLFGLEEVPLLFDVFLHLATLLAVSIYFWPKIWNLLKIFGRWIARKPVAVKNGSNGADTETVLAQTRTAEAAEQAGRKTIIAIIISTVITGALGVVTSKVIPDMPVKIVCAGFLVTSALLITSAMYEKKLVSKIASKKSAESAEGSEPAEAAAPAESAESESSNQDSQQQEPKGVTIKQSIAIGIMQGLGTLPGISRSGSTISGALFSGLDRSTAGDYSFIVSIPAILGAFILEVKDLGEVSQSIGAAPVIAGCAAAFAVGYISLATLMKLIKKGKLQWFAAYLIPVAVLGILFL